MSHPYACSEWLWVVPFSKAWGTTPGEQDGMKHCLQEMGEMGRVRARGGSGPFPDQVHREDVIGRMRERGMELRILDPQWIDRHPIEDPEHPNYIAEAHAVFAVWRDLRPRKLTNEGKTRKRQIAAFLTEHFPRLNKNQHEQIAALMNPDRLGGAPSSKK